MILEVGHPGRLGSGPKVWLHFTYRFAMPRFKGGEILYFW